MAANPQRWKAPDSLSDAIDMLQDLRGVVEDLEQQVESVGEDAETWEERAKSAEARADEVECAVEDHACELARSLMLIKRGRIDEARDTLDRILQEIDGDCRARMSAVILPAQPSMI